MGLCVRKILLRATAVALLESAANPTPRHTQPERWECQLAFARVGLFHTQGRRGCFVRSLRWCKCSGCLERCSCCFCLRPWLLPVWLPSPPPRTHASHSALCRPPLPCARFMFIDSFKLGWLSFHLCVCVSRSLPASHFCFWVSFLSAPLAFVVAHNLNTEVCLRLTEEIATEAKHA